MSTFRRVAKHQFEERSLSKLAGMAIFAIAFHTGMLIIFLASLDQSFLNDSNFNIFLVGSMSFTLLVRGICSVFKFSSQKMKSASKTILFYSPIILAIIWSMFFYRAFEFIENFPLIDQINIYNKVTLMIASNIVGGSIFLAREKIIYPIFVFILITGLNSPFFISDHGLQNMSTMVMSLFLAVFGIIIHKNEQKKLQIEEEENQTIRTMFDNIPGALIIIDNDTYTYVNSGFTEVTGISSDDFVGNKVGFLSESDQFSKCYRVFTRNNLSSAHYEIKFNTLVGEQFFLAYFRRIDTYADSFIICNLIDIDEKVRAEKELAIQMSRSSHASKMVALGEMSGNLAHEINNPLTIIQLQVQNLRFQIERKVEIDETLNAAFSLIESTVLRISKIIKSLRNFSREGHSDPAVSIDISEVIKDTLVFCESRFRSSGVQIDLDLQESINCKVKPIQISQVILNALSNSYDAVMENDSGEKWVKIKTQIENDHCRITVTDNGLPIPPDIQEKIMTPFFTTKPVGKGTGLGLSISKSFIEHHNGKIYFNFQKSNTELTIELPLADIED